MIKVDFDDSWLKYHYRRTDRRTDNTISRVAFATENTQGRHTSLNFQFSGTQECMTYFYGSNSFGVISKYFWHLPFWSPRISGVLKVTLQSQMSVRGSVCPSAKPYSLSESIFQHQSFHLPTPHSHLTTTIIATILNTNFITTIIKSIFTTSYRKITKTFICPLKTLSLTPLLLKKYIDVFSKYGYGKAQMYHNRTKTYHIKITALNIESDPSLGLGSRPGRRNILPLPLATNGLGCRYF